MIASVGHTRQMDSTHRLDRLRVEGSRLIEVAGQHLEAPVPACPEWTCRSLLHHVTAVWQRLSFITENNSDRFPTSDEVPARPARGNEVAEATVALDRLHSSLSSLAPDAPMWSWIVTQSSSFYFRRAHQETLVHRIDAEQAAGIESIIDSDDAADGVDERFFEFVKQRGRDLAGSFHVHRTDGEGEWTLVCDAEGRVQVSRDHAKGDAAIRGTGADLLLTLWGRRPLDGMEVFGDQAVAEAWIAVGP